ncbi:MAG: 16S rRNA (cytosine(967)-C(5))-methyltransferase RsmB [Ruminococcaceae bacterium]|nr:16S rRNA (cytosine(967)-C(5))-methyltransferase RsmB [Oscillospiraceae bacterium]
MNAPKTARALALRVLLKCENEGGYSNLALDTELKKSTLDRADRALVTELVFGVIERRITLDYYISKLAKLKDIEPRVLTLIRLGIYQLAFLDRVPPYAAVNESVSLAPKRARGFVNAVLRSFMRLDALPEPPSDPMGRLSVLYSYPTELCALFCTEFGEKRAESILAAMNGRPPVTLRVNTLKTDRDAVKKYLFDEGIEAENTAVSPVGLNVEKGAVASLSGFAKGDFFVQDEASQICAFALGAMPGELIIDTCSAPGSKSFSAAINMKNEGRIISCDLHKNKLSLIENGAKRLGISIIDTVAHDAREPISEFIGKADRVICDVPCSGFGVIGKKPEIRYKNVADTENLPKIQYDILNAAAKYLKNGGTLVYSTCTVLDRENGANVRRFLKENPDFYLEDFSVGNKKFDAMTTLLPDTEKTDGFFIAHMRKK